MGTRRQQAELCTKQDEPSPSSGSSHPQGTAGHEGDISDGHNWDACGTGEDWLVAFSGCARHPTVLGTAHHNNYPAQNIDSAKDEEPCDRGSGLSQGKKHRQKI